MVNDIEMAERRIHIRSGGLPFASALAARLKAKRLFDSKPREY